MRIELSERAALKFKELAEKNGCAGAALRIAVVGGGCSGYSYSMVFAEKPPSETDKIFECFGVKIYIDKASVLLLDGTEIDYVGDAMVEGFKFNNPNAKITCGCGESFSA